MCRRSARDLSGSQAVPDTGWRTAWARGLVRTDPALPGRARWLLALVNGVLSVQCRGTLAVWGPLGGRGVVSCVLPPPRPVGLWGDHPGSTLGGRRSRWKGCQVWAQLPSCGAFLAKPQPQLPASPGPPAWGLPIRHLWAPMGCHHRKPHNLHVWLWHGFVRVLFCSLLWAAFSPLKKSSLKQLGRLWLITVVLRPASGEEGSRKWVCVSGIDSNDGPARSLSVEPRGRQRESSSQGDGL